MQLTDDAQADVNRMRTLYRNLIDEGYTDQNAHDKVVCLNGHLHYDLVCLATERARVDYDALRRAKLTV